MKCRFDIKINSFRIFLFILRYQLRLILRFLIESHWLLGFLRLLDKFSRIFKDTWQIFLEQKSFTVNFIFTASITISKIFLFFFFIHFMFKLTHQKIILFICFRFTSKFVLWQFILSDIICRLVVIVWKIIT